MSCIPHQQVNMVYLRTIAHPTPIWRLSSFPLFNKYKSHPQLRLTIIGPTAVMREVAIAVYLYTEFTGDELWLQQVVGVNDDVNRCPCIDTTFVENAEGF